MVGWLNFPKTGKINPTYKLFENGELRLNLRATQWNVFLEEDKASEGILQANKELLSDFGKSVVKLRFDFEDKEDPTTQDRFFGSGTVVAPNLILTSR